MGIVITGSQHERIDGKVVISRPHTMESFLALQTMTVPELKSLGMGVWSETDEHIHMLYPKEWYDTIPNGLEMLCISGRTEIFEHGKTDDDYRFGCLAFGFLVKKNG